MKKSILLADDSRFMRTILKDELDGNKYEVIAEAENGLKAIAMYKEFVPDIVLMDITMPELSGIEALKEIINIDSAAIVVMCSALGSQYQVRESLEIGAKNYIVKPFFTNLNRVLANL